MYWIISPFIIINQGTYRTAVFNYSKQTYQTIPLSAAEVLAQFTHPLKTSDLLACYNADEQKILESYLQLFKQNGWILNASSVENFQKPDLVTRKPVKRIKNVYLHTSTLATDWITNYAQLRRDTGVHYLMLIPDCFDFHRVDDVLASQFFRQVAVVVLEASQLEFAATLAEYSAGRLSFFVHERVFEEILEIDLQFPYEVILEHRVEQPSNFGTDLRLLLNNSYYSSGVDSLYIDTDFNVYPHPLDKGWPLGRIVAPEHLRPLINGEAFTSYQQTPRRLITKCADCELNLGCVLSLRSRRDPNDLHSAPENCGYDIISGDFRPIDKNN